jgi:hypothetical protein
MLNSQITSEQKSLKEQLKAADAKLAALKQREPAQQHRELEDRLNEVIAQSEIARSVLAAPIKSFAINNTLYDTAKANSVNVTDIRSSGITDEEMAGINLSSITVSAAIVGDIPNIVSFVMQLNQELPTGVIKSLEITAPEENDELPSSNIKVVVYFYREEL